VAEAAVVDSPVEAGASAAVARAEAGDAMKQEEFLARLEDERIVAAIQSAEGRSSGEIRVYISESNVPDALSAAGEHFIRMNMTATRERNGVLLYFAPESQTFAVVGDVAIHERCGESFWRDVANVIAAHLKSGAMTEAIVAAVEKVGAVLAEHFPRSSDDQNELPDRVERGN
jgi:uncharacterized membrane protein